MKFLSFLCTKWMENCEAMTSPHSFAYSYRLVKKCFLKICETSKCHNFLIFQPIFIRFSLLCLNIFTLSSEIKLTLSGPISLHSHKPPGPHCFEPFTCNVYRSFQPQNMHMCKQFLGKVSTAKMFFENQTYLWFVWFFLQNENELKIKEIFLPWKAKHTGKIVAP